MSRERLFENDEYGHSIWWNKRPYAISVTISDKEGTPIKILKIDSMDYVIVPPGGRVELMTTWQK